MTWRGERLSGETSSPPPRPEVHCPPYHVTYVALWPLLHIPTLAKSSPRTATYFHIYAILNSYTVRNKNENSKAASFVTGFFENMNDFLVQLTSQLNS